METIGSKKKACMALLLLICLLLLSACREKSEEPEADLTVEQQENEIFEDEKQQEKEGYLIEQEIRKGTDKQAGTDKGENEAGQAEGENMEEALEKYTYRGDAVLTEENFRETMKTYLCIKSSAELHKLEDLPLTESFFEESIGHSCYIKSDLSKMKEFYVAFWGVGEDDKIICLCEIRYNTSYPYKRDCYYIEMEMENNQIDSMEITLVEKYKANIW